MLEVPAGSLLLGWIKPIITVLALSAIPWRPRSFSVQFPVKLLWFYRIDRVVLSLCRRRAQCESLHIAASVEQADQTEVLVCWEHLGGWWYSWLGAWTSRIRLFSVRAAGFLSTHVLEKGCFSWSERWSLSLYVHNTRYFAITTRKILRPWSFSREGQWSCEWSPK